MNRSMQLLPFGFIAAQLTSCGLHTPELQAPLQTYQDEEITLNHIENRVKCELIQGIIGTLKDDDQQARDNAALGGSTKLDWLKNWSAQVTLTITAVESSAVNPGFSYSDPFASSLRKFPNGTSVTASRAFTVGFGGSVSSAATRIDKLDFFFAFKDFLQKPAGTEPDTNLAVPCQELGKFLESDLKLGEWLREAVSGVYTDSIRAPNGFVLPISVISHEVSFLVMQNANANPGFKLTEFAFSQTGSPLFQAVRNKTDDVVITLGPTADAALAPAAKAAVAGAPAQPSTAMINSHLASEIGASIAAAIRSNQ